MHHHGSAGNGGAVQTLLVVAVVITAAVHLWGRSAQGGRRLESYRLGHALMAAGMVWMLLPASWTLPLPAGLALVFGLLSGAFAALWMRRRKTGWRAALRYGDLVVGHAAMAYMLRHGVGDGLYARPPLTAWY